jgi:hypothetical protein
MAPPGVWPSTLATAVPGSFSDVVTVVPLFGSRGGLPLTATAPSTTPAAVTVPLAGSCRRQSLPPRRVAPSSELHLVGVVAPSSTGVALSLPVAVATLSPPVGSILRRRRRPVGSLLAGLFLSLSMSS